MHTTPNHRPSFFFGRVIASSLLLGALLPGAASADLPPPDGTKFVDFAVAVDNLSAFSDRVLVVYPWSMSNGAPTQEHAVVKDGVPLGIGRRSAPPKLWAVKKADYDAFTATYKPSAEYQDAPLEAFFASGKPIACDATVEAEHQLPSSDPRDQIVQRFRADAINDTTCHLVAVADAAGPPLKPSTSSSPEAATPHGGGGCAGCTTAGREQGAPAGAILTSLAALALVVARRRRRP